MPFSCAYLIDNFFIATNSSLLAASPNTYVFPDLLLGQSAQTSILLTNAGQLGLTGTVMTVGTGPITITGGASYVLAPGAVTNVSVQFSPVVQGDYSETIQFLSDGGAQVVQVSGSGLVPPHLAVSPSTVPLGPVVTGGTAYATFVATNSGGASLTGTASVAGAPFAIVSGAGYVLPAGGSTNVVVAFSPLFTLTYTGEAQFASNGGNATNRVTGTGFDGPLFGVSPAFVDLQNVIVNADSSTVFVVTNRGSQALSGTASVLGSPFTVDSGSAFTLAAGAWTTTVVRFAPTAPGTFTNPVEFLSNGGNATSVVVGTGFNAPILGVSPGALLFGDIGINVASQRIFTVTNRGSALLTGSVSVPGPAFAITAGASFSLLPGDAQAVTVTFMPTNAAAYSNDVSFASNGGASTNPVTGTGVVVEIPATLGVGPGSHYFGSLPALASSQVVFVVTNSGTLALTGTASVAGAPFSVVQGSSFILAGGGATNVIVVFSPTGPGSFFDTVDFASNGGQSTNALTGSAYLPTADSTNLLFAQTGGVFHLVFQVTSGAWYHVQASTNLLDPAAWTDIGPTSRATGGTAIYNETSPAAPSRIYRVLSP